MKRLMLLLMSVVLICNCDKGNFGYDKKVYFPSEGGTIIVDGNDCFYSISIVRDSSNYAYSSNDLDDNQLCVSYLWLTAQTKSFSKSIAITAEPNDTGKARSLTIYGDVSDTFARIIVTQY